MILDAYSLTCAICEPPKPRLITSSGFMSSASVSQNRTLELPVNTITPAFGGFAGPPFHMRIFEISRIRLFPSPKRCKRRTRRLTTGCTGIEAISSSLISWIKSSLTSSDLKKHICAAAWTVQPSLRVAKNPISSLKCAEVAPTCYATAAFEGSTMKVFYRIRGTCLMLSLLSASLLGAQAPSPQASGSPGGPDATMMAPVTALASYLAHSEGAGLPPVFVDDGLVIVEDFAPYIFTGKDAAAHCA